MWISRKILRENEASASADSVEIVSQGVGRVNAVGSSIRSDASLCLPYGYKGVPPKGEAAVMLEASGEDYCIGVCGDASELEVGEIRICSAGGACIELKNDGRVLINGKEV